MIEKLKYAGDDRISIHVNRRVKLTIEKLKSSSLSCNVLSRIYNHSKISKYEDVEDYVVYLAYIWNRYMIIIAIAIVR
jgi:hypothetical protein